ncbi:MAG: VOC family protein [Bryobacterales bacterium]|nr:VOC family protein [Bryobacterales bacterium]
MSETPHNNQIDYIEFAATDLPKTKAFYAEVFGWKFEDYGPEYSSFSDGRIAGGFTTNAPPPIKGTLVVLYASDLEGTQAKVKAAGAAISREIFSFPGGRRFHFQDPSGNELAVWSE